MYATEAEKNIIKVRSCER